MSIFVWTCNVHEISNKVRDRSKHRTITVDTVLESWNFILWNKKILGTIGVPFGTQSTPINARFSKNIEFYKRKNAIMVPKMVPQWYPKCLMVRYPNTLTHFLTWWIFIIFRVQKMATWPLWQQFWVPSQFFGYHRLFFG